MNTPAQTMLGEFVDLPEASSPPVIVDRSTAERYASCPFQGAAIERRMVTNSSPAADVGNEAHRIIAEAVKTRATDGITPNDMREYISRQAFGSRPDVQPEVIRVLRKSYPIVGIICYQPGSSSERNPGDLLRYDGGEGGHAGQLAADIYPAAEDGSRGPVRLTCEVDLLMATVSVEEIELVDWKSGWKWWTASEVKDSFQFQFYAWVIFANYPKVKTVRVSIFMTREGQATGAVEFRREHMPEIHERLKSAVNVMLTHRAAEDVSSIPAWPSPDKCSICCAAPYCVEAHRPERDLANDPEGYLRQYVALETAAATMKANLTKARRARGQEFEFGDVAFGTDRPKKPRASDCDSYSTGRKEPNYGHTPSAA